MSPEEHARRRVELAREIGAEPAQWIATSAAAAALPIADGMLLGVPVAIGQPRSEWGLELKLERRT